MWNNPIYKKEVKINIRSRKFALTIFFFNLFLAAAFLVLYSFTFSPGIAYRRMDTADILFLYSAITCVEICIFLFLTPTFTISSISGECEKGTLEVLFTTRLSCMQIVCGKQLAALSHLVLLILSSMPILALVFSVGGVSLFDILQFQFLLLIAGCFIGSIGIYFSCHFKKTAKAAVYTYGSVFLLLFGSVFVVWILNQINGQRAGSGMANVLLVNPIFAYITVLAEQYGYLREYQAILSQYGGCSPFVLKHWFLFSTLLQLLLSCLLLMCAARRLNPNISRKLKQKNKP